MNDGRHGKYKMVENQFANAKARMNNSEGFWSKFRYNFIFLILVFGSFDHSFKTNPVLST